jgi:hypothetical protein
MWAPRSSPALRSILEFQASLPIKCNQQSHQSIPCDPAVNIPSVDLTYTAPCRLVMEAAITSTTPVTYATQSVPTLPRSASLSDL